MGSVTFLSFSLICLIHLENGVLAQANLYGPPSIVGTILKTDCATYPFSFAYELLCPLPGQSENLGFCDSHCRCIHLAKWGRCGTRPPTAPIGTGFGSQWCTCSYEDPPEGFAPNPGDSINCPLWKIVDPICYLSQVNDTAGGCSSDCICAHGYKNGYCNKDNYCICTNGDVDPALAYGNYPLMGFVNQLIGGRNANVPLKKLE